MTSIIVFYPDGNARCLWTDSLPLSAFGHLQVRRASRVEFNPATQQWEVWLDGHPGPAPDYSHPSRQTCLHWEIEHLQAQL